MTNEEKNQLDFYTAAARERIPDYMIEGVVQYVMYGKPSGGFLMSVFSNDLMGAMARADSTNQVYIKQYCDLLYNQLPSPCHGSSERVQAWINKGGLYPEKTNGN